MTIRFRVTVSLAAMAAAVEFAAPLYAAPGDTTADAVLGQADFAAGTVNAGGGAPTASSLNEPHGLAIDRTSGRLFVPDRFNHRVLSWPSAAAFTNGQAADLVLGQPNFTSNDINQGATDPTARTMNGPKSIALDSAGRLYVADAFNIRILRFDPPFTTNMPAVAVFGQGGSFTTKNQANLMNANANNLSNPDGIAIGANDRLYCADRFLSRVTVYSTPLTSTTADLVIGQPNLTTAGANLNQTGLDHCSGVALDAAGNLYVGDEFNNRVMLFLAPLSNGKAAARVFGQPDFASNTGNNGGLSASTLRYSGSTATLAIDPVSGSLFVSDALNHRILEYVDPLNDSVADRVFGQLDFASGASNTGGRTANTLNDPAGVALDAQGNLYVSDRLNHRVLRFNSARIDLGVSASAAPNPVTVGSNLTFTITVSNAGPDPATTVTLAGTLPIGATFVSATTSQGTCSGAGPVNCSLGTIASGASATISIVVTPTAVGTANLTATADAADIDTNAANDAGTASATVNTPGGGGNNNGNSNGGGNNNDNSNGGGGATDNDNDGVPNASDNCPDDANPDQADDDRDGIGDACDDEDDSPSPIVCGPCGPTAMSVVVTLVPLLLVKRRRTRRGS